MSLKIKAITLHQPWAAAVAFGMKRYETRSWATKHRGPMLIHAAKKWNATLAREAATFGIPRSKIILGAAVCVVELVDCIEMTEEFILKQTSREIMVGDWQVGRFAWRFKKAIRIRPIKMRGRQSMFSVELDRSQIKFLK